MNTYDTRFAPYGVRFQPMTINAIQALEDKLGASFPASYVAFLLHYGGCGFSGEANVLVEGDALPILAFFNEKQLLSNIQCYDDLTAEKMLAFADDLFANPFVLDCVHGAVYFLDFTVNPPKGTKVASSYDDFLRSIQVTPDE